MYVNKFQAYTSLSVSVCNYILSLFSIQWKNHILEMLFSVTHQSKINQTNNLKYLSFYVNDKKIKRQ